MKASIIIVNYNGGEQIVECLRSLQNDPHSDYEIIVVDNHSTDGSPQTIADEFPEIGLICSDENPGFGGGNNLGAKYARGEFLAFLNPDTVVESGWLDELVKVLETYPDAGMATSQILLKQQPDRINTCGNDVHISGLTLCRGMGKPRGTYPKIEEVGAISGAAFALRRSLFEYLGGFDERFFMYMEDTDLSLRARLAGFSIVYVPSSIVYHDYALNFGPKKTFYQERNRYLMLLKCLRWSTLIVLLPALVLAEVVTWGFVFLRERRRLSNKLRAYAWIVSHWGEVMRSRRQVQALRQIRDRDLIAKCVYWLAYEQVDNGFFGRLSHLVFDPLFLAFHKVALVIFEPLCFINRLLSLWVARD